MLLVLPFSHGEETNLNGGALSYTERFKAFIVSPPVIEDIVFRKKLPLPGKTELAGSTNFTLYRGAWQTNALLFYEPENESASPAYIRGKVVASVFGTDHRLLQPGSVLEVCHAPFGSFENSITLGIYFRVLELNQVLQAGVMHARPGEITWSGNRFSAENVPVPERKFRIEGELVESGGRPDQMLVKYTSVDSESQWRIAYSYETPLDAEFFPSRVRAFVFRGGTSEVEVADFQIIKLRTASQSLPPSVFDLAPLLATHPTALVLHTNNALHRVLPDGTLDRVEGRFRGVLAGPVLDPQAALAGIAGINFLFLFSILKRRRELAINKQ
jgi:hypothetical protein